MFKDHKRVKYKWSSKRGVPDVYKKMLNVKCQITQQGRYSNQCFVFLDRLRYREYPTIFFTFFQNPGKKLNFIGISTVIFSNVEKK